MSVRIKDHWLMCTPTPFAAAVLYLIGIGLTAGLITIPFGRVFMWFGNKRRLCNTLRLTHEKARETMQASNFPKNAVRTNSYPVLVFDETNKQMLVQTLDAQHIFPFDEIKRVGFEEGGYQKNARAHEIERLVYNFETYDNTYPVVYVSSMFDDEDTNFQNVARDVEWHVRIANILGFR